MSFENNKPPSKSIIQDKNNENAPFFGPIICWGLVALILGYALKGMPLDILGDFYKPVSGFILFIVMLALILKGVTPNPPPDGTTKP